MTDHNGVLVMQRLLLAGTLGLTMAQKAAAILEGEPNPGARLQPVPDGAESGNPQLPGGADGAESGTPRVREGADGAESGTPRVREGADGAESGTPQLPEGAVLRAILDAANECLGHFDDRPPGERWCDALFHLLDLATFAADLSKAGFNGILRG